MYCKVVDITTDEIIFDNGFSMSWHHDQHCCEGHYLDFDSITMSDLEGLEFDLFNLFEKVDGYGIRLLPVNGHPVAIPGYGKNTGNYSSNLEIVIKKTTDVSECQTINNPDEDEDEDEDVTEKLRAISVSNTPVNPKPDDSKAWYRSGKLHRDGFPAIYDSVGQNHDTPTDVLMKLCQNEKPDFSISEKFLRFLKTRILRLKS